MAVLALVAASGSCTRAPTPIQLGESVLGVHGVVRAGADTLIVLLTRNEASGRPRPEPGATIEVARGSASWRLVPVDSQACSDSPEVAAGGCYGAALPEPIASGERFDLRIETARGERIEGRAVVPRPPLVDHPVPGATVVLQCPPGARCEPEWGRSAGALRIAFRTDGAETGGVEIAARVTAGYAGDAPLPGAACVLNLGVGRGLVPAGTASLEVPIGGAGCLDASAAPVAWDSLHVNVLVTSFDTAYARYREALDRGGPVRAWELAAGLQGAAGIFVGAASTVVPVSVHRTAAAPAGHGVSAAPSALRLPETHPRIPEVAGPAVKVRP